MPVFVNMSTTFGLYGSLLVLSKYLTPKHHFPNVSAELQYLIVQYNITINSEALANLVSDLITHVLRGVLCNP